MSKNVMLNVKPEFDLCTFSQKLSDMYRAKGYGVNPVSINGMYVFTLCKNDDGFNHWLGLGEELKVSCTVKDGILNLTLDDSGAWTNKIIALAVGWFVCCIPLITGIMGCMRQSSLAKNVENDAMMLVSGM